MIFRQITNDDLGCASYLIGDEDAGVAAVVDPKLDIEEYLRLARYLGVTIEHILETHNHADHVSGHGGLAAATGATIHIHEQAKPAYDHRPFRDRWELELGSVCARALHTPGHRPEHTAFALIDRARGLQPWAVLTGDSLFVGDTARLDLAVDKVAHETFSVRSATSCWCSRASAKSGPPISAGRCAVAPGMDMKVSSTIAYERAHQPLLAIVDEHEFVQRTTSSIGPQPPNFKNIVALNRGPMLRESFEAHPLAPRQVDFHQRDGALIADMRTELQFAEAHIPGALCLTDLRAGFGSKLAWLANPDRPVVLVGRDDADAHHAVTLAAAVGITSIAGYLAGGMTSWREESRAVQRISRITAKELHNRLASDRDAMQVLDVREQAEWDTGYIPGSVHEPYHDITELPTGLDPTSPVAVICASGQRAAVGASLVQLYGAPDVTHVVEGGVPLWQRHGWPIESPKKSAT